MNTTMRRNYPKEWKKLSTECKDRAGWKCEKCFVSHRALRLTYKGDLKPVYLVAAHINHDRHNPNPHLCCLCPSCHWRYYRQFGHRPVFIIARLRAQGKMK